MTPWTRWSLFGAAPALAAALLLHRPNPSTASPPETAPTAAAAWRALHDVRPAPVPDEPPTGSDPGDMPVPFFGG